MRSAARFLFVFAFASLCLLAWAPVSLAQQESAAGSSFITPFPEGDVYKVQIVGDTFADGVLSGLVEALGSDSRLRINRKYRAFPGLARAEFDEELNALDEALGKEPSQIIIAMLGRDDRVSIRQSSGRRIAAGSNEWREEYGRRADRMMKVLKRRGGAVYWLGLPVLQRAEWNETVQLINDIVRDRAHVSGLKFIDTFAGFADENGAFVALGPDAGGLVRRLRETDGIGFTAAGNRKLAYFVERELRRDLNQAKAERSIPLAGSEAEQQKINPKPEQAQQQQAGGAATSAAAKRDPVTAWANPAPRPPAASIKSGADQKADNSRIVLKSAAPGGREETANVDILRPPIAASVIELVARNGVPERATQIGDTLQEVLPGGLLLLSSVTPAGDAGGSGRRPRLSPTQTPYFRVMIKGEQLPPQPGRMDDFRWPRSDQTAEPAPVPQPAKPVAADSAAPAAKTIAPRKGLRPVQGR